MKHLLIRTVVAVVLGVSVLPAVAQSQSAPSDLEQTMTVSEAGDGLAEDTDAGQDLANTADQRSEEQGDVFSSGETGAGEEAEALALINFLELDILSLSENGLFSTDTLLPDDLNDVLNNASAELAEITEILSLSELLDDLSGLGLLPTL